LTDIDVPFVSSSELVVIKMLEMVNLKAGDILFDLGCGDGRIIVAAAQNFGATSIGIEKRRDLASEAGGKIRELNLSRRTAVMVGDFYSFDLSSADVVVSYLLTVANKQLESILEKELRPKSRVVSHDFEFPDWKPTQFMMVNEGWLDHKLFLYVKEIQEGFKKKEATPEPNWRPL
jgi:cyclopropane fatty-acyl-phospholipid synthase-like methyltransferase